MTPQLFAIFAGLIEERAGLHYALRDAPFLEEKLRTRATSAGFDSLLDYYYFLRYDPDSDGEFAQLVDALVVNETYFFREYGQLVALVDGFLARVPADRQLRVWSAACSTGEEPLTLAMLLEERGLLDRTTIIASDISTRALALAKEPVRSRRSLRAVPNQALADRWLEVGEDRVQVDRALIDRIDWRRINLLDRQAIERLGRFDAIICRNVLIYFRPDAIGQVVDSLLAALEPGGVIAVGVSESLMRLGSRIQSIEEGGFFFYGRAS